MEIVTTIPPLSWDGSYPRTPWQTSEPPLALALAPGNLARVLDFLWQPLNEVLLHWFLAPSLGEKNQKTTLMLVPQMENVNETTDSCPKRGLLKIER
jgi:hypothetical protein